MKSVLIQHIKIEFWLNKTIMTPFERYNSRLNARFYKLINSQKGKNYE